MKKENTIWFSIGAVTGLVLLPFVYFLVSSTNALLRSDNKKVTLSHIWRAVNAEYPTSNYLNIMEEKSGDDFIITMATAAKDRPVVSMRGDTGTLHCKSIAVMDSKGKHIDIRFNNNGDFDFTGVSYPVDDDTRIVFDYLVDGIWDIDVQGEDIRVNYFDTILKGKQINGTSVVKKDGDSFLVTVKNGEVHLTNLGKTKIQSGILSEKDRNQ